VLAALSTNLLLSINLFEAEGRLEDALKAYRDSLAIREHLAAANAVRLFPRLA